MVSFISVPKKSHLVSDSARGGNKTLANFRRRQAVAFRTRLRRERVLVALGKGRNRWTELDAVADHFLRVAAGWNFRFSAAGNRRSRTQFFLDFDTNRCLQTGSWLRAGRSGRDLSLLALWDLLLYGVIAGELLWLGRFRASAPSFRTYRFVATGSRFLLRRHLGGSFRTGLLLAVFVAAEIGQSMVLARRKRTSLGQLPSRFQVFHCRDSFSCFTENFEHLDAGLPKKNELL